VKKIALIVKQNQEWKDLYEKIKDGDGTGDFSPPAGGEK
jgi:hypothetical protein